MEIVVLYVSRILLYALAGIIAYKKRMWWLLALTVTAPFIATLATFYSADSTLIRAILANLNAVIIVMIAVRNTKLIK